MSMPLDYDSIIIGAGHNGLVCASILAQAGQNVLVLEAAAVPGGGAIIREFVPGFSVPALAHLLPGLPRSVAEAVGLPAASLASPALPLSTTILSGEPPVTLQGAQASGVSQAQAASWQKLHTRLARFAAHLRPLLENPPPRLGTNALRDTTGLLRLAWQIRSLGRADMRELLRIIGMNIYDLAEETLQSPALRAALCWDAVLGANQGPRSPGTVLTLLNRLACMDRAGPAMLLTEGAGNLAATLAQAARGHGATLRLQAPVARILVENDRACGVVLETGETLTATRIISNADPHTTYLRLLGAEHLDTGFVRRITHYRDRGLAAKLHLALRAAPEFSALSATALRGRLVVASSPDMIERAFNPSKYREIPEHPALECVIPTLTDPSLAPAGQHVLSAIIQFVPHTPAAGWTLPQRQGLIAQVIAALETHAPGLSRLIVGQELLTPDDIEQQFHIHGGHWHHGELSFDQFYMVRPVPGAAQYSAPIAGLYLCGAGAHPGGDVHGLAGRNAARRILQEIRA